MAGKLDTTTVLKKIDVLERELKTGIQLKRLKTWIPAFAGMTR